jgi:hypothetical protein
MCKLAHGETGCEISHTRRHHGALVTCVPQDLECRLGGAPTVHGNPIFTDEFSQEYSNDLEPGGQMSDTYYRLLAYEVNRRKLAGSHAKCL